MPASRLVVKQTASLSADTLVMLGENNQTKPMFLYRDSILEHLIRNNRDSPRINRIRQAFENNPPIYFDDFEADLDDT